MQSLMFASSDPISHIVQHGYTIGEGVWQFPILTNHVFMQVLAALLLIWLIPKAVQQRRGRDEIGRLVPQRGGNMVEAVCVGLREQIFKPNLGPYTDVFSPYLWSLFFFVALVNILGVIPLGDWFGWVPGHWIGGTGTGNIWTTAALTLLTFYMVVYNGLKYHGVEFLKHFFMGPWYLAWFIGILEILGMFFKHMALCIRLFANMIAGHIVLAVLLSFVPVAFAGLGMAGGFGVALAVIAGSVAFNFLEILVAFVQAFIIVTLTAVFIGQAVNIQHHHSEAQEHGEHYPDSAPHGHGHATAPVPAH